MDYVVFDLETTGLETAKDAIIEIGAIKVCGERTDVFEALLRPRVPSAERAIEIHHISNEEANEKGRGPEQVLGEFLSFIGDLPLVGHNIIVFDASLLANELQRYGLHPGNNPLIDVMKLSYGLLGGRALVSLSDLCSRYGISNRHAHRALSDTKACAEVFKRFLELEPDAERLHELSCGLTLSQITVIPEGFDLLDTALTEGLDLCITYQGNKDQEPVERWVFPFGIVLSQKGFPSMKATCREDGKAKLFRLDRISSLLKTRKAVS